MTNQKSLVDKLLQASAIINNNTRRGSSNYMLVSKSISDVINGFRRNNRKEKIMRIFNDEARKI
jgi:hypothetical protein